MLVSWRDVSIVHDGNPETGAEFRWKTTSRYWNNPDILLQLSLPGAEDAYGLQVTEQS